MAFIDCKSLPLNLEFQDVLINFTLEAMKRKPINLYEFAATYFQKLMYHSKLEVNKSFSGEADIPIWKSRLSSTDTLDDEEYISKTSMRRVGIASESWNPTDFETFYNANIPTKEDKSDEDRGLLKRLILRISIFKSLGDDEIDEVISAMSKLHVREGEVIIHQGDPGDHFYVIQSGLFDVFIRNKYEGLELVTTYNNQGSFGELSLLYNSPRSATVIAKTRGVLWYMNRKTFKSIVIMKAHMKRLKCVNFISSVPILDSLDTDEKLSIADSIHMRTFEKGVIIIKQGEIGKHMYFIESGKVFVFHDTDGIRKQLDTLSKGQYFGELSLMTNRPRAATIIAAEKTVVGMLERSCFERLLGPCLDILQRNAMNYEKVMRDSLIDIYLK